MTNAEPSTPHLAANRRGNDVIGNLLLRTHNFQCACDAASLNWGLPVQCLTNALTGHVVPSMLVFQPLQPGGRDVVFERRPGRLAHRSSQRPLFSHLPICHGLLFPAADAQPFAMRSVTSLAAFTAPTTFPEKMWISPGAVSST